MNKMIRIAILDSDKDYIYNFNDYMKGRQSAIYNIEFFTESEKLDLYCRDEKPDIIVIAEYLISEYAIEKFSEKGNINKEDVHFGLFYQENKDHIAILTEEDDISSIDGISVIYRYQSADMVINSILQLCTERELIIKDNSGHVKKKFKGVVSIYSPIGRCGKTKFVINMGMEMVKRNFKVLLINLEEFSLLMEYMNFNKSAGSKGDLSDLLYFYISGNSAFHIKTEMIIENYKGLDFIPPTECIRDLRNTDTKVVMEFVRMIGSIKGYDMILIDLSNVIGDIFQFISMSDKTIVPFIDEEIANLKLQKFKDYIDTSSYEILEDSMIEMDIKNVENSYGGKDFIKVADELEKMIRGD